MSELPTHSPEPGQTSPPSPYREGEELATIGSDYPANEKRFIVKSDDGKENVLGRFPDCEDPTGQYNVPRINLQSANLAQDNDSISGHPNVFCGPNIFDEATGMLYPSCYFTIAEASEVANQAVMYLAKEHRDKVRAVPQIGVTFADQVKIPRFHVRGSGHPLSDMIEAAELAEIKKLCSHGTFDKPIDRATIPADTQVIDTMFVYKVLADSEGKFAGIRARLTLRGDQQAATRYRKEATAPVYLHVSLRILLIKHTCDKAVRLFQADVGGAYLTSFMRSKVFGRLPARYRDLLQRSSHPSRNWHDTVVLVLKALYGGDDSGRCFYDDWVKYHKALGFNAIAYDRCYLYLSTPEGFIEMLWHVDDTLYFSKGEKLWQWYQEKIGSRYEMIFREVLDGQTFTGFRISRYPELGYSTIDQQASVDKTLRALGHDRANLGRVNPIQNSNRPTKFDAPSTPEEIAHAARVPYLQCVGCLQWLQCVSHAELTYAIKVASMRVHDHGNAAWNWCKQILGFLSNNPYKSLVLRAPSHPYVNSDTDSDYSKDPETRKSLSGGCCFIGDALVLWWCDIQRCISMSTTEAELVAAELCVRRTRFVINLAEALGFPKQFKVQIRIDNDRAYDLATQPIQPGANGHLHARYLSIVEWHEDGLIQFTPVDSALNRGDIMVTWKTAGNFHRLAAAIKGYQPIR